MLKNNLLSEEVKSELVDGVQEVVKTAPCFQKSEVDIIRNFLFIHDGFQLATLTLDSALIEDQDEFFMELEDQNSDLSKFLYKTWQQVIQENCEKSDEILEMMNDVWENGI